MFSVGGIVLSPMLGILMESLLAEVALTALGRPRRLSFMLAGCLATLWTLVHPFLTQGILAGSGILTIYERTLTNGARALGLDPSVVLVVLAALIGLHLAIGTAAGLAGLGCRTGGPGPAAASGNGGRRLAVR